MTAPPVHVETDLAASILAMWTLVRTDLAAEQPKVGRIEGQAEDAFARHLPHWKTLIADACDELAGEHSGPYAKSLGALVSGEAAKGLALGMGIQLGRGQNPEVAWQRVLSGYGLDPRGMRGLLGGAMQTPNAGGAGAAPDSLARTAVHTLLVRAQKLAATEATAWKSAKEEIAKAFDPREPRDRAGKWTATPQVLEREQEAPEKAPAPTTVPPETDRSPKIDRYAATETDRYAATQTDRYATAAPSRYAAPAAQAVEAPAAQGNRYAVEDRYAVEAPAPSRTISTTIVFAPKRLGAKPPEPEPPPRPGRQYYLPLSDIPEYFHGQGVEMSNHGPGYNSVINFKAIADYYRYNDIPKAIKLHLLHSEWEAVNPIEGISATQWDAALKYAVPLHKVAMEHPVELSRELGQNDLEEIAVRAGYQAIVDPAAIKDEIAHQVKLRKEDPKGYDPSLLNAMADYVVWSKPDAMTNMAEAHNLRMDFQGQDMHVADVSEDLGVALSRIGIPKLRLEPILGVVSFRGGLHGKDAVEPDKVTGTYNVQWVTYKSAIGEHGLGADVGKIGFREITTKPEHRV